MTFFLKVSGEVRMRFGTSDTRSVLFLRLPGARPLTQRNPRHRDSPAGWLADETGGLALPLAGGRQAGTKSGLMNLTAGARVPVLHAMRDLGHQQGTHRGGQSQGRGCPGGGGEPQGCFSGPRTGLDPKALNSDNHPHFFPFLFFSVLILSSSFWELFSLYWGTCQVTSGVSDSLRHYGLKPVRLLCP